MGVPLMRVHVAQQAYNPQFGGIGFDWLSKSGVSHEHYERTGLSTEFDTFEHLSVDMHNVVATLNGTQPGNEDVFIVCAHFDSISEIPLVNAPCADDNGSGTAAAAPCTAAW